MKQGTTKKRPKTQAELAKEYGVNPRTIRTYQVEGAPLDDPTAMADWIDERRGMYHRNKPLTAAHGRDPMQAVHELLSDAPGDFLYGAFAVSFAEMAKLLTDAGVDAPTASKLTFLHFFILGNRLRDWRAGRKLPTMPPMPMPQPIREAMKAMGLPDLETWDFELTER